MADGKTSIGFIGLGLMGQALTRRLVACGYRVGGYDIVPEKMSSAQAHGVRRAGSAAEVAHASDQAHVCVMTRDDLAAAVFEADGIAAGGVRGKLLVDRSTTEVATTKAFAERLKTEAGRSWIDAPVSGGPPAAAAGTLAIMASGEEADFTRAQPVPARRRSDHQDGQPGAGAEQLLHPRRSAGAGRGGRDRRGEDPRGAGIRLCRQYHAAEALSAPGGARLRPRGLCLPGAQGPRHAAEPGQGARGADPDERAGDLAVPHPHAKGHGQLDGLAVVKLYDPKERL